MPISVPGSVSVRRFSLTNSTLRPGLGCLVGWLVGVGWLGLVG